MFMRKAKKMVRALTICCLKCGGYPPNLRQNNLGQSFVNAFVNEIYYCGSKSRNYSG
jgi:hypothetical protein